MTKVALIRIAILCSFLLLWQFAGLIYDDLKFYISSPIRVIMALREMILFERYLEDFVITGTEACLGLIIGILIGTPTGLALHSWAIVGRAVEPIIVGLAAIPILAISPLAIIWLGIGISMKVGLAAVGVFFIVVQASYIGANVSSQQYAAELNRTVVKRRLLIQKVVFPGAFTRILDAMRNSVGTALLGAFIGEFIASDRGLGYLILKSTSLYNVSRSLAAAVGIAALAVALDYAAKEIRSRQRWIVQLISVPRPIWSDRNSRQIGDRLEL